MTATATASPWQLARRAARMNPSVIREILKITERPGIVSLAGRAHRLDWKAVGRRQAAGERDHAGQFGELEDLADHRRIHARGSRGEVPGVVVHLGLAAKG